MTQGKTGSPLFVGLIIDVSSSMRRNWKNKEGKDLPRIEAIRDALNKQFQKYTVFKDPIAITRRSIDVFCIGMGFKRPMYWSDVEITYGHEKSFDQERVKRIDAGVVCDVLALSEIVPNKTELRKLEKAINDKWQSYAHTLLKKAQIEEGIEQKLQAYIQSEIYESAYDRLYKSIPYRSFQKAKDSPLLKRFSIGTTILEKLEKYILSWESRIDSLSESASKRYSADILSISKQTFDREKDAYVGYIGQTLNEFSINYSKTMLQLLTLGHSPQLVLDYFDEATAIGLASQIYQYLEIDVKQSIKIAWIQYRATLYATVKTLGASIDFKDVQDITEKCIQKYSWGILEPFVQQTVETLFTESFKNQAKEMMPTWIGLAASREISRTSKQIATLLPDSLEETIYSEDFMFGTTPIEQAMNIASLRMLDKSRKNSEKILVLISDGEFSTNDPIETAALLKRANVRILCCYLTDKTIMSELKSKASRFWPDGAKKMFDMASPIYDDDPLVKGLSQKGYYVENGKKLFYQVNESEKLGNIIQELIG